MTRAARGAGERGDLVLVLHSHMPYVEGFGTWPFGEEWLWEAVATVYLPLLEVLPDVRGHVFGRCGHAAPVERTGEFNHLLTTFLETDR